MFGIFRLLIRSEYWRTLFGKNTWSMARISLRRAHKDTRAGKYLLAVLLLLLGPLVALAYLAWLVGSGAIFFVPFVIPVIWWIRRSARRDDPAKLSIAPAPAPVPSEPASDECGAIREHFAQLALVYAVFLDRGASEAYLKNNPLPSGHEAIARRRHLELMRRTGIWEKLAQADRDALIDGDGQWDWERINRVALTIEPLRSLRWILRLDSYLPLVGHQLKVDAKLARELVDDPEKILKGTEIATVSMIETGRDAARSYVARCIAELISRGCEQAENEEMRKWADEASASVSGKQSKDLLLDGKLVSESNEEQIRWALTLAHKRAEFLHESIDVIEGTKPVEAEFAVIR